MLLVGGGLLVVIESSSVVKFQFICGIERCESVALGLRSMHGGDIQAVGTLVFIFVDELGCVLVRLPEFVIKMCLCGLQCLC
jgi:hypothetical protein